MIPCIISKAPNVSFIVIGRNDQLLLRLTIPSIKSEIDLLSQAGISSELIYVDSSSKDNSAEIAKEFGARVIIVESEDLSAALGRLAGTSAASGKIIVFSDSDMMLIKGVVLHVLNSDLLNSQIAGVSGSYLDCDVTDPFYCSIRKVSLPTSENSFLKRLCGFLIINKADLIAAGGYDPKMIMEEETDLLLRLYANKKRVLCIDQPLFSHLNTRTHKFSDKLRKYLKVIPSSFTYYATLKNLINYPLEMSIKSYSFYYSGALPYIAWFAGGILNGFVENFQFYLPFTALFYVMLRHRAKGVLYTLLFPLAAFKALIILSKKVKYRTYDYDR